MREQLLQELALSERIVRDGHEVVPRFRVLTPHEEWTIFCPLPDDMQARIRGLGYIREFLAWKGAHGAIVSAETWLGPMGALQNEELRQGEAIVSTLVSKSDIGGVMRMINRKGAISFGAPQWFGREHVDPALLELLPGREEEISPEMMRELEKLSFYGFRSFNELLEEAQARGQLELEMDEKSGGYVIRGIPRPS